MGGGEQPLVEVDGLTVEVDRVTALDRVRFAVAPRAIHAVIGPNGAGKSTLLAALLGQAAFRGAIRFHWRGSGRIGYVPQRFDFEKSLPLTVAELLALSRQRLPVCLGLRASTRAQIAGMLAGVGLAGFERRPVRALSGGELQRVLLANATAPAPELLVLDEPSSALDATATADLETRLLALKDAGTTVLLVSHDLPQVARIADRVTVLDRRVLFDGPAAEAPQLETRGLDGVRAHRGGDRAREAERQDPEREAARERAASSSDRERAQREAARERALHAWSVHGGVS